MKYLTVTEAEQQPGNSFWVLNTTDSSDVGYSGDVLFDVPKLNGNADADHILVEQTWLPQDLTEWVPKNQLLQASELRRCVRKGLISIISEADAIRIMQRPGAKEERQRIRAAKRFIQESATARAMGSHADVKLASDSDALVSAYTQVKTINPVELERQQNVARAALAKTELEDGVEPSFAAWAQRLHMQEDIQAVNAILNKGKMTKRQLKVIMKYLGADQTQARANVTKRIEKINAKKKGG
ncbi:hypothetical protein [Burkholderia phage BCSR5]|nr:hypothetical protein [Burkholderia phage BCSR5]